MSHRAFSSLPDDWRARQGQRPGVTIFHGWDSRLGLVVTTAAGGLLTPLLLALGGVWAALLGLLALLIIGLGSGYRLVVAPEGIEYRRTWYGVPWSRRLLPLQTPITDGSTFDQPETEDIVLEAKRPVTLPASRRTAAALRQAVQEAILRAGREQTSPHSL